jgi:hypothetical protein
LIVPIVAVLFPLMLIIAFAALVIPAAGALLKIFDPVFTFMVNFMDYMAGLTRFLIVNMNWISFSLYTVLIFAASRYCIVESKKKRNIIITLAILLAVNTVVLSFMS